MVSALCCIPADEGCGLCQSAVSTPESFGYLCPGHPTHLSLITYVKDVMGWLNLCVISDSRWSLPSAPLYIAAFPSLQSTPPSLHPGNLNSLQSIPFSQLLSLPPSTQLWILKFCWWFLGRFMYFWLSRYHLYVFPSPSSRHTRNITHWTWSQLPWESKWVNTFIV